MNTASAIGFAAGALVATGAVTWFVRLLVRGMTGEVRRGDALWIAPLVAGLCVGGTYVVVPSQHRPERVPDFSRRIVVGGRIYEVETAEERDAAIDRLREELGDRFEVTPDSADAWAARRAARESDPVYVLEHTRAGNVLYPLGAAAWAIVGLARPVRRAALTPPAARPGENRKGAR